MLTSPIGDLLSSASLLLAGVGVVYGAWYTELTDLLQKSIPPHSEDRVSVRKSLQTGYWRRALPLAVFSAITSLILLPDAIAFVKRSVRIYTQGEPHMELYDALATLFVTVEIFSLMFAIHLATFAYRLGKRLVEASRV